MFVQVASLPARVIVIVVVLAEVIVTSVAVLVLPVGHAQSGDIPVTALQ